MKRVLLLGTIICLALLCACTGAEGQSVAAPTAQVTAAPTEAVQMELSLTPELTPEPTAIPVPETPEPTATPTPTETPEPTEEPTPEPDPIAFTASLDLPLPDRDTQIQKDLPFWIDGTVKTVDPLVRVSAVIVDEKGREKQSAEVVFDAAENITEYELLDKTFSKEITDLSEQIRFDKLGLGAYTLTLSAEDAAGRAETLASCDFRITNAKWIRLQPNNLRANYTTALAFFGSPERFLFRFSLKNGGPQISVESEWSAKYFGTANGVNGKSWSCHVDAIPYFEKASRYIEETYVHISGSSFDTGAVRLTDLFKNSGTLVRRFTNSKLFLSHHSLGTAIDVNAHSPSNKDKLSNREIIYREVTENLTYNGVAEVGGHLCYDFTYTGTAKPWSEQRTKVPEPLMNYLLYELAFYRAGFSWGVYYPHTSDAMHFSLSELSPSLFEEGEYAMRKVFEYIDE